MSSSLKVMPSYIMSRWLDSRARARLHLFLLMPSGVLFLEQNLSEPEVVGGCVRLSYTWGDALIDAGVMFGHTQFIQGYYHEGNDTRIKMKASIDKLAEGKGEIKSVINIPLPKDEGPFEFTPKVVSGHDHVVTLVRKSLENEVLSSVILMIDLQAVSNKTSQPFTERKVAKSNFSLF